MIHFFRRIRQKLLANNQMKKYFLYAIGEIVLVMIGILLALQVNSWNEEKKNIISEKEVLTSILLNLEEDNSNIDKSNRRYGLTRHYIERFINGPAIPDDSIAFISTRVMGHAPFIHNQSSFDLATNSGALNHIRDKALIQKIQNFYSFESKSPGNIINVLQEIMGGIRELSMEYEALKLEDINRGDFFNATYEMPFDIAQLKKRNEDPRMSKLLRDNHFNMGILIDFYNQIQHNNKSLHQDLTQYLDQNFNL